MQDIKIPDTVTLETYKYGLAGTVKAIASKSVAHRLLIAAALSDAETDIICEEDSKDISATADCLNHLGAEIAKTGDTFHVVPISLNRGLHTSTQDNPAAHSTVRDVTLSEADSDSIHSALSPDSVVSKNMPAHRDPADNIHQIDCGESGSTLRFLLPVIGILGTDTDIYAHGRLPQRPLSPLYEEMISHGTKISPQGEVPLRLRGRMQGGIFNIPGNVSSQYITGLLFALPLADTDSEIRVYGKLESRPYIDITLQVLKMFEISVEETKLTDASTEQTSASQNFPTLIFKVPGRQVYKSCRRCTVEGDWSNAAFWLSAGALSERGITTTGLNMQSLQGDKKVLDILKEFGAQVEIKENPDTGLSDVTVKRSTLKGITIDASDIPDLIPILSVVACAAEGRTEIKNIERLRIKESDRVYAILTTIKNLGGTAYEEDKKIIICGGALTDRKAADNGDAENVTDIEKTACLTGGTIDSFNDHRIAMMAGIASSVCSGPVTIKDAGAVQKSYPGFYNDLIKSFA